MIQGLIAGWIGALIGAGSLGCTEYALEDPPPPKPATPPGIAPDEDFGQPPDWLTCAAGYHGQYFNLEAGEPMLEPPEGADPAGDSADPAGDPAADPGAPAAPEDPAGLDWWARERRSFVRYDPGLDFGANWWPVDEGLEGDPRWFSARWTAWLRALDGTTVEVLLGASSDAWVLLGEEVWISAPGPQAFAPEVYALPLGGGVYPLDVRAAHRAGDSAVRFRVVSGDVQICYPDFSGL